MADVSGVWFAVHPHFHWIYDSDDNWIYESQNTCFRTKKNVVRQRQRRDKMQIAQSQAAVKKPIGLAHIRNYPFVSLQNHIDTM